MIIRPNIKTNTIKFFTISVMVIATCVCFTSQARQVDKASNKISVKCHVELLGGGETIHFAVINENKLTSLKHQLANKLIMTTESDTKQRVYQATECVPLKQSFKGTKAKAVDLKTAR